MKSTVFLFILLSLLISCGDDDAATTSSGSGSGTTSSTSIVSAIDKSVGSMAIFTSPSKKYNLDFLNAPSACSTGSAETPSDIDYHCTAYGTPLKTINGDGDYCSYTSDDTTYVSEIFYCSVIFNTASPDSLRGVLTLANLIECSLRAQNFFDFSSGNENTGEATIGLTTSNTCFDNFTYTDPEPDTGASTDVGAYVASKLAEIGSSITVDATVTKLTTGDWDYNLVFSFTVEGEEMSMNLKLKNSNDIVAASMADDNEAWSVSVNQDSGVMSFETIDKSNYRRRRTRVAGTFDDQGELDLTQDVSLKAWILEQCINTTSSSDDDFCDAPADDSTVGWYEFTTIEGAFTAATNTPTFKQYQYSNIEGSFTTPVDAECSTGTPSDCDSITGISGNDASISALSDATDTAFTSMSNNRPLLEYTDVDTSNTPWE